MIISCAWNAKRAATFADMDLASAYLLRKKEVVRYVVALEHFGQGRKQHLQIMYELSSKRWEYFAKTFETKMGWAHERPETYQHVNEPRPDDPKGLFAFGYCFKEVNNDPALYRTSLAAEEVAEAYAYHEANCEEIEKPKKVGTFYKQFELYIYDNLHTIIGLDKMTFWRDVQMECFETFREARWTKIGYDEVMYEYICEYGADVIPRHMETNMKKNFAGVVYFCVNKWMKDTSP